MTGWIAPAAALIAFGAGAIAFSRLPPARGLAVAALSAAVGLALLRHFSAAIPLAIAGLMLARRAGGLGATPSRGQRSEIRTDALAMWLDHDIGSMDGEVLGGALAGRRLSELSADELQDLAQELQVAGDEDSLSLLMGYLDRERETDGQDRQSGAHEADPDNPMSEAEAYRILGLEEGSSLQEVRNAYRRLIRRVHPDLGGSNPLASMINAAKQVLDPD